jgi:exoribonuclease-2
MLENRLGEEFDAIVTGASHKGTWARLLTLPVEGKVVRGAKGLKVGKRLRVRVLQTDVEAGYIDLGRV